MSHTNEEALKEISKLRWVCRRGMRELDIVLRKYLDNYYLDSTLQEQQTFKTLLDLEDPLLFAMLMDNYKPENTQQKQLINKLQNLFKNPSVT